MIIAQGRLRHASSIADLRGMARPATHVVSPRPDALAALAASEGWASEPLDDGLLVSGRTAAEVGARAHAAGLELHRLSPRDVDLEAIFFDLTRADGAPGGGGPGAGVVHGAAAAAGGAR